jgi:small-conductance mechanosensitive channel
MAARSTAIDTELRGLAAWLKSDFKDPFPKWKYPIAPVLDFLDSAIKVAVKFYIDNVRMEKYMRMGNTFTQFRLRIVERLSNAGITIPFPQRDVNIRSHVAEQGRRPDPSDGARVTRPEPKAKGELA